MRVFIRSSVGLALLLLSHGAYAQSVAPETRAQAERHMARGIELRSAGRDEEAIAELRTSYQLVPDARAAAQLGLAHQALGQWVEADRLLRVALAAAEHPWVGRNRAALEAALGVIDQRVGSLIVRGNVQGAEVRIDGNTVARLPMSEPVRVAAGEPSLEVSAPGYTTVVRRLRVEGGATVRETVELREAVEGDPAPNGARTTPRTGISFSPIRVLWIASLSLGSASGIASIITLAISPAPDPLGCIRINPMPVCTYQTAATGLGITSISLLVAGLTIGAIDLFATRRVSTQQSLHLRLNHEQISLQGAF